MSSRGGRLLRQLAAACHTRFQEGVQDELSEIMTPEVVTIDPNASLQQAAQIMASLDVGILPVMVDDDLLGVITDRDITVRAAARGLDPKELRSAWS